MASLLSSGDPTLAQILSYQATSADLSFDNSYYFTSDYYGYAGYRSFNVYYWNTTTSSWDQKYTQTTSQTNFGYQIACTWDGDRFVIGSPDENKVYVYHSPGGSGSQKWTHNASGVVTSPTVYTISCPDSGSRRFGWSVSIAKDLGNHIVIGAPGTGGYGTDTSGLERGKVYIYEFNGSTWSKTFDKTANQANTDCDGNTGNNVCIYQPQVQRYPSATTSSQAFYRVTDSSPQFGYYVDISGYAEYIAIGVPGTGVARLRAQNMDGYNDTTAQGIDVTRSGGSSDYIEDIAMLGCIVCYKTTNANKSWSSNTSIHGKPVLGQTEMSLDAVPASHEPQKSFDFTALGTTCKISLDGTRLIGGSPRYSYPGMQASPHFGRLDAWNYSTTDTEWALGKGRVVGHRTGNRLGMKIAIDYTGQRVAALLMEEPDIYDDEPDPTINKAGLMVYDWNGNGFYEVTPEVQTNLGSGGHNIYASIAISKGDVIAAYAHGNSILSTSKTSFYFYKLTGGFDGNSLVGGYCAADTFLVGPNDGSTQNTFKKQIKFGGTFFDNTYENTTIENRIYQFDSTVGQVNHQGYSELLLSKKTTGAAPDMIRLKSNELRIDNHVSVDQDTNNTFFSSSADGEYDHNGALLMNVAGNFKINPEYDISRYSGSTTNVETFSDTQAEVKASLDVEGDIFGRRRINAGYLNGQKILGRKWPWQILYDTRSGRVKQGDELISNTFCEFNAANMYTHGRINSKGVKSGTMVTHYETQGAIKFTSANDYILNNDSNAVKSIGSNGLSGSLWIKLENEHSSYPDSGAGGCTLISYGNPSTTSHTGMRLQIEGGTNPNIRFRLGGESSGQGGSVFPSNGYIFKKDKWYHIYYAFRPNVGSIHSSFDLWINNVSISPFGSYSLTTASYNANHYIGSPLGDTATNVYIGMVAHFNSHIDRTFHANHVNYVGKFPNASEMYYWGSPQEKMAVGGDAFIENRLSIGGTHSPDYPLDVTGDINFTGTLRQNDSNLICIGSSSSAGAPLQVFASTSNTSPTNNGILLKQEGYSSTNQHAIMAIEVANANSGDPFVSWNTNVTGWCMGIDNIDNDKLKIANSKDSLDTETHMEFSSSGTDFKKAILANGSSGTNGQVLTSGGSGGTVSWTTVSGGGGGSFNGYIADYITHDGDTNTYFGFPSDDTFIIKTNGTERLRANSSGNIGIGTATPGYKLDVVGDINMSSGSSLRINGVAQSFGGGGGSSSSLSGSNTFEWGTGVSGKEGNAGKIGYSTFSGGGNNALDIVGAGTSSSNRNVRIYDNIGIGTSSPEAYLHVKREGSSGESNVYIQSYSDSTGDQAALFLGTPHYNSTTAQPKCAIIADAVGWSRADLHFCLEGTANNGSAYRASTSNSRMMIDGISGNVGIGTTSPLAPLDVNGSSSTFYSYAVNNYFRGASSNFLATTGTWNGFGIRASGAIGTNTYFVAHTGTWGSSDSRIKTNINDVTDASALEKLRLLEPKTYKYIDTKEQGNATVYGFIAQEVSNVFPEAVMDSVNTVPNIYELSNVSDSNVITFTNFNTSDLLTSNVTSTIQVKSVYDKIERLTLDTVIDSKSIRVKEDLTNIIGSIDDTGNVVSGNQVFIMGQEVDNFNIVKKEYIFTIATAALQEVDRQLQAEKTKVSTLETQVVDLLARVTALENA